MKLPLRYLLGGAALLAGASSLQAIDQTVRVSAFYSVPGDSDFSGPSDAVLDGEGGLGLSLAWGVNLPVLRAEVEFLGAQYDYDGIQSEDLNDFDGDYERYGLFGNAIFDLPGVPFIDPYIGAGVGVVRTSTNLTVQTRTESNGTVTTTNTQTVNDANMTPAVQFMVGLKAEVADKIYATAGYRLLYADQDITESALEVSPNELSHFFELGLGYNF
ncbi:MAG: outer membrane beta-barrel protein [Verrucomicrobiota bacterium JB022]|nr:outer membrane beta-barrel protein [Verrucomicrobiota bacterium JB022]